MRRKLVFVITRLDKGSSSEDVLVACKRLDKNKYDILLLYGYTFLPAMTITFPAHEIKNLKRDPSLFKDMLSLLETIAIFVKEKPDIIHSYCSKAGIIARWAALVYNLFMIFTFRWSMTAKVVHTPHGHVFYGYEFSAFKTKMFIFLEKISAHITTKLIALTQGEKNETLAFGVGKPNQWVIVHSAVGVQQKLSSDKNLKKQLRIPDNAIVIGTVARLEPVKGIKYFIEAAIRLKDMEFDIPIIFLIVGEGEERDVLEKTISDYQMRDCVIFAGMMENVADAMAIMDVYVQTSTNEGMGKSIVQAESMGIPVIASRVQGTPYALKENESGYLVPPRNPQFLAQAIYTLIQNPELMKKMGDAGIKFVNDIVNGYPRFSSERMIHMMEEIYDTL